MEPAGPLSEQLLQVMLYSCPSLPSVTMTLPDALHVHASRAEAPRLRLEWQEPGQVPALVMTAELPVLPDAPPPEQKAQAEVPAVPEPGLQAGRQAEVPAVPEPGLQAVRPESLSGN